MPIIENMVMEFIDSPFDYKMYHLINSGMEVYRLEDAYGHEKDGYNLMGRLVALFGRPNVQRLSGHDGRIYMWLRDDRFIMANVNAQRHWSVIGLSTSLKEMETLKEHFFLCVEDRVSSTVSTVVQTGGGGLALRSIGRINTPLERGNYDDVVLERYDYVVSSLQTSSPCGRLIVMDGPPGTGKTHMIRGLVADCPHAHYIIVGSTLAGNLTGPAVMNLLVDSARDIGDHAKASPMVLIMEDADSSVADRESVGSRQDRLGDILNLGDGLLGEMLDLRVIITTNTKKVNLDPAIQRPGRMCAHIHIPQLSRSQGHAIYKRITGKSVVIGEQPTLAEIYRMAREDGWEPKTKVEDEVGGNYA